MREQAILKLWRDAIDELSIVHLDPAASVICEVLRVEPATVHGNLVVGQIRIENARDTSKLDAKTNGVSLPWKAHNWPGRQFVHAFVAACWSSVMAHEGLETVLYKNRFDGILVPPATRVHDPHTTAVRIDEDGTHLATQGRMEELVRCFIGDIEPLSAEEAEKEIAAIAAGR
ncbi:MAG TPA: hypothetical protein VIY48_05865 [Candidatus Paceibacterota bacterium]